MYDSGVLPMHRDDRIIENWDYDQHGRWGMKQYIRCWTAMIVFLCIEMYIFWVYLIPINLAICYGEPIPSW